MTTIDEEDEAMIRLAAIIAAAMSSTRGVSPNTVVSRARRYERYIRGDDDD